MKETAISGHSAHLILLMVGLLEEWDPLGDWYVRTTEDGQEELWRGGDSSPTAVNRTTLSWLGSFARRIDDGD